MLFLLIAGVSANDINTTNQQIIIDENIDVESSTVDQDVIGEDLDERTFTDLNVLIQNASENSEIKLDKDYSYDKAFDSEVYGGIEINKPITIDGQGHKIDANNSSRIFYITHNNITLKNMIFVNGQFSAKGGAIYYSNCNDCNIINSTFNNNIVTTYSNYYDSNGGAIYYSNCNDCNIINSTFNNNSATISEDVGFIPSDGGGGYILCRSYGGAIYYSYCNDCNVINSTFNNNTSSSDFYGDSGGAIYYYFNCSNSSILNCKFNNNNASYGGAIYCNLYNDCLVRDCIFFNNSGGAIESNYNDCKVINSTFIKNNGFAISGECSIINSTFIKNMGAISYRYTSNVFVINCNFFNTSSYYANTIEYYNSYNCSVINCNFINASAFRGGAISYHSSYNCSVINCNFINTSAREGGAIYYYYCNDCNVINCNFINNTAEDEFIIYDCIDYSYNNKTKVTITLSGITIENCTFIGPSKVNNIVKKPKTTKILAKKKTFKAKTKTKKYTISLKAGKSAVKKVKVYLKIKDKTYKATTNKKGKATFKIKKLTKKGTYKSKIIFKGNNLYKPVSKKVTIKIK